MQTASEAKNITRAEYVALVTSRRRLIRTKLVTERMHELFDSETNERFWITERDLLPNSSGEELSLQTS